MRPIRDRVSTLLASLRRFGTRLRDRLRETLTKVRPLLRTAKERFLAIPLATRIGASVGVGILVGGAFFLVFRPHPPFQPLLGSSVPPEIARRVSHLPADTLLPGDFLSVRFVEEKAPRAKIGVPLEERYFEWQPEISGKTFWSDARTLSFQPDKPLPARAFYKGRFLLEKIFPELRGGAFASVDFSFLSTGRELLAFDADFRLHDENDPAKVRFEGRVLFNLPTTIESVRKSLRLEREGLTGRLATTWTEDQPAGRAFRFQTEVFERIKARQNFRVRIDKGPLDLPEDGSFDFPLEALGQVEALSATATSGQGKPVVEIPVSDQINTRKDYSSLVEIVPKVEFKVVNGMNRLMIEGDFAYNVPYVIRVAPGILSRWGVRSQQTFSGEVTFRDLKPEIEFADTGVFLPGRGDAEIAVRSMNLNGAHVTVHEIFENNLLFFLQSERLRGSKRSSARRGREWEDYGSSENPGRTALHRVGVPLANLDIDLGTEKNRWQTHSLKLPASLRGRKGLYLIEVSFQQSNYLFIDASPGEDRWGERYFSSPYGGGYLSRNGRIQKTVILSDLGLIAKSTPNSIQVWATSLRDAEPLKGVSLRILSFQNKMLQEGKSDGEGKAVFSLEPGQTPFLVYGEKGDERSLLKFDEMGWNTSGFDTEGPLGDGAEGWKVFFYRDRGVVRPGEAIQVAAVIRDAKGGFPSGVPIQIRIRNSRGQLVKEETIRDCTDGFFAYRHPTEPNDPTGPWQVEATVGQESFRQAVHVETIVPSRIAVKLEPGTPRISLAARNLSFDASANYLFGAPGSGLESRLELRLLPRKISFPSLPGFLFQPEAQKPLGDDPSSLEGTLDAAGTFRFGWTLPEVQSAPPGLDLVAKLRVMEKGGRPVFTEKSLPVETYPLLIGVKKPELSYPWFTIGQNHRFEVAAVTADGRAVPGRLLVARFYLRQNSWWWDRGASRNEPWNFKNHQYTTLVEERRFVSSIRPVDLHFEPRSYGEYLLEVQDPSGGAQMSLFFDASGWGDENREESRSGTTLVVRSDRKTYAPGDTALLRFPASESGVVLFTLEKANRILESRWIPVNRRADDPFMEIRVPVTREMAPNVFASISMIQPWEARTNDRPIRLYGIARLLVEDPFSRIDLAVDAPEEIRTGEPYRVNVRALDGKKTRFTLAVVDEGLLQLTSFATPDPWKHFYRPEGLGIRTYDLFDQVLGRHRGDVYKTFRIGGGEGSGSEETAGGRVRRYELVSDFLGPFETDGRGVWSKELKMSNYIGAVRIMAVAARGESFGGTGRTVPVRGDLALFPSLPRVLGPGDAVDIPVTVFPMKKGLAKATISLQARGPVAVDGHASMEVEFNGETEKEVRFRLRGGDAIGLAKLRFTAEAGTARAEASAELEVKSSLLPESKARSFAIEPGVSLELDLPAEGRPGSRKTFVQLSPFPFFSLSRRFDDLIHYPYGCLEQTTSAAFPQLYLKYLFGLDDAKSAEADRNVRAGIDRLRSFRTASGAFSYWPGGGMVSEWANLHAGHFLIEAKRLGFDVPDDLLKPWLEQQKSEIRSGWENASTRIFRLHLLALAGEPQLGAVNLVRENRGKELDRLDRWMLAATYKLCGAQLGADELTRDLPVDLSEDYRGRKDSFGSLLRDKGLLLLALLTMDRMEDAKKIGESIGAELGGTGWHSTQTLSVSLLALGRYATTRTFGNSYAKGKWRAGIRSAGGDLSVTETLPVFRKALGDGETGKIVVQNPNQGRLYGELIWRFAPLEAKPDESRGLSAEFELLDEKGATLDPKSLRQGTTFFLVTRIRPEDFRRRVPSVAASLHLPGGWEIRNNRLSESQLPAWARDRSREDGACDYLDIRDGRQDWFFDLEPGRPKSFVVQLDAVSAGEFRFPGLSVEAMYDHDVRATKSGTTVTVTR